MLYKMKDIVAITGFGRKKLDQWYQKGILKPEVPPRRAGCASGFSKHNMVEILLTEKLGNTGIVLRTAGEIATEATETVQVSIEGGESNEVCFAINLEDLKDREYFYLDAITPKYLSELLSSDVMLFVRLDPLYKKVEQKLAEVSD